METRDFRCEKCGHLFNTEHPFYSEDFAMSHFPKLNIGLSWCFHCNHVSEYKQSKILGLIPTKGLKLSNIFHLKEIIKKDYFGERMDQMGGLFGYHFLRMIWHSIDARSKLECGSNHNQANTLQKLLGMLPPLLSAVTILSVANTSESISLEDQIHFGIYSDSYGFSFIDDVIEVLEKNEFEEGDSVIEIIRDMVNETRK